MKKRRIFLKFAAFLKIIDLEKIFGEVHTETGVFKSYVYEMCDKYSTYSLKSGVTYN